MFFICIIVYVEHDVHIMLHEKTFTAVRKNLVKQRDLK